MKTWIKQILRENLEEIAPKPKPVFGKGSFHKVFPSKQHPDRLYKVGEKDTVEEWLSIFKAYPKYFPKIYREFPYAKNPTLMVVEIEKIDTVRAANELNKIDNFLFDVPDTINCEYLSLHKFFDTECIDNVIEAAKNDDDPYLLPMIYKWAKFLRTVSKIVYDYMGRDIDIHVGNVAYDNKGNLKMIDI